MTNDMTADQRAALKASAFLVRLMVSGGEGIDVEHLFVRHARGNALARLDAVLARLVDAPGAYSSEAWGLFDTDKGVAK